jgi:hypothetical protein
MNQLVHFPCSLGVLFLWLSSSSFLFLGKFAQFLELFEVLILGMFPQCLCFSYLISKVLRNTKGRRKWTFGYWVEDTGFDTGLLKIPDFTAVS